MSDKVILKRKLVIGGYKLSNGIDEFTPPKYNKVYSDRPGSFVGSKVHVGYEPAEWSVSLKGEMAAVAVAANKGGKEALIIYTETGTNNGQPYETEHTLTGEVNVEEGGTKMRDQQGITLTGQIQKHVHTENGTIVTNVDVDNGKYDPVWGNSY
ncbi:hypothetical protein HC752_21860 [Vibrio sp. S9_S30]|uniref:phage major tail tube protein n=1 Tax=Vibrio sp. S9_S30 TaxID=2720226 RepID=UPI001680DDF4|nr:phage major tail tube protein [Vibrio sp. S9_S30]MBD1559593.1 hypothetical protein [Vibrio sp. S9_S30]